MDAVDLGLILLDGDRRVIGWNAWIEKASGIANDAARRHRLDELFPGRIPPRLQTAISQTLELGASSLVTVCGPFAEMLERRGIASVVRVGARREQRGAVSMHAWLEVEGRPLIGREEAADFVPLSRR